MNNPDKGVITKIASERIKNAKPKVKLENNIYFDEFEI